MHWGTEDKQPEPIQTHAMENSPISAPLAGWPWASHSSSLSQLPQQQGVLSGVLQRPASPEVRGLLMIRVLWVVKAHSESFGTKWLETYVAKAFCSF